MDSTPSKYTVIEEYVPPAANDTSIVKLQQLPTINSIYHTEPEKPLDNPILGDDNDVALFKDLFGDPLDGKCDKMETDTVTSVPAPAVAPKVAMPEFSKEYKDSLQANEENTADIKLDNIELPNIDDKELKNFLEEMDAKAKAAATTTTNSYYTSYGKYGGYSGHNSYGYNEYDSYRSRYSHGYGYTNNHNNYDLYNEKRKPAYTANDWYADKKAKTEDTGVKFSDDVVEDTVDNNTDTADIKDLNELKKLINTKFTTNVKLFTRTITMLANVKTTQAELKKMYITMLQDIAEMKRGMDIMGSQMAYVTRTVRAIKDRQGEDDEYNDGKKSTYYGINYSDDDDDGYFSPDDITKKSKFDNTVPELS
jgi:hypothetical protein